MSYSKETIWHFTCEFCKGWWSIAASDEWHPSNKILHCPLCGKEQGINEDIGYTGIM